MLTFIFWASVIQNWKFPRKKALRISNKTSTSGVAIVILGFKGQKEKVKVHKFYSPVLYASENKPSLRLRATVCSLIIHELS